MTTVNAPGPPGTRERSDSTPPPLTWRQKLSRWDTRFSPVLYVVPFFVVFGLVGVYPMVYSAYLSFFSWPRFGPEHGPWVGLANYVHVIGDPVFHKAFWNTVGIFLCPRCRKW